MIDALEVLSFMSAADGRRWGSPFRHEVAVFEISGLDENLGTAKSLLNFQKRS
jgi:hypothetical protein